MSHQSDEATRYSVEAFNYAHASENKIHDDATARRFGFSGGLVPGVADFAYMVRPVVDRLGRAWLENGAMKARFKSPVYEGEQVEARATPGVASAPANEEPAVEPKLELELRSERGVCAEGSAWTCVSIEGPRDVSRWPHQPAPDRQARPLASLDVLAVGTPLASVALPPRDDQALAEIAARYRDESPLWHGDDAALHPAEVLAMANEALVSTVELGPWIHVASELQLTGIPPRDEALELRCLVAEAYARRGHETVVIDGALVSDEGVVRATVRHTAIIRPRQVAS